MQFGVFYPVFSLVLHGNFCTGKISLYVLCGEVPIVYDIEADIGCRTSYDGFSTFVFILLGPYSLGIWKIYLMLKNYIGIKHCKELPMCSILFSENCRVFLFQVRTCDFSVQKPICQADKKNSNNHQRRRVSY